MSVQDEGSPSKRRYSFDSRSRVVGRSRSPDREQAVARPPPTRPWNQQAQGRRPARPPPWCADPRRTEPTPRNRDRRTRANQERPCSSSCLDGEQVARGILRSGTRPSRWGTARPADARDATGPEERPAPPSAGGASRDRVIFELSSSRCCGRPAVIGRSSGAAVDGTRTSEASWPAASRDLADPDDDRAAHRH